MVTWPSGCVITVPVGLLAVVDVSWAVVVVWDSVSVVRVSDVIAVVVDKVSDSVGVPGPVVVLSVSETIVVVDNAVVEVGVPGICSNVVVVESVTSVDSITLVGVFSSVDKVWVVRVDRGSVVKVLDTASWPGVVVSVGCSARVVGVASSILGYIGPRLTTVRIVVKQSSC